jgi:hypothetical protein
MGADRQQNHGEFMSGPLPANHTAPLGSAGERTRRRPQVQITRGAPASLRIGTQDGESCFQGGIAALRIWSRALTNREVCDLYQSDLVPPDGLVAQYLLDEGSGTVAADTSGGNNNGTIYGATWMTM